MKFFKLGMAARLYAAFGLVLVMVGILLAVGLANSAGGSRCLALRRAEHR